MPFSSSEMRTPAIPSDARSLSTARGPPRSAQSLSAAVLSLKTSMTSTIRPTVTRIPGFHSSSQGPERSAVRLLGSRPPRRGRRPFLDGAEDRDRDGNLEHARHLEALAASERQAPAGFDVNGRDAHDRPARFTGSGSTAAAKTAETESGGSGTGDESARAARANEKRTFNGTPPKRRLFLEGEYQEPCRGTVCDRRQPRADADLRIVFRPSEAERGGPGPIVCPGSFYVSAVTICGLGSSCCTVFSSGRR